MFFVVVLCDTIMVVMMTRRLTRPLKILSRRAKEVTAGDLSVDIRYFVPEMKLRVCQKPLIR